METEHVPKIKVINMLLLNIAASNVTIDLFLYKGVRQKSSIAGSEMKAIAYINFRSHQLITYFKEECFSYKCLGTFSDKL